MAFFFLSFSGFSCHAPHKAGLMEFNDLIGRIHEELFALPFESEDASSTNSASVQALKSLKSSKSRRTARSSEGCARATSFKLFTDHLDSKGIKPLIDSKYNIMSLSISFFLSCAQSQELREALTRLSRRSPWLPCLVLLSEQIL